MRVCAVCRFPVPFDDLRRPEMRIAICIRCWEYHTEQRPPAMPRALRAEYERALEGTASTDWWKP